MSSQIYESDPGNGTNHGDGKDFPKSKVTTDIDDIEADPFTEERSIDEYKKSLVGEVEKKELTAVEAFQWNVEGDQSPCGCSLFFLCLELADGELTSRRDPNSS